MKNRFSILMRWIALIFTRSSVGATETDPRRASLLLRACACIRVSDFDQAADLLDSDLLPARDAARVNLLGVLCEKRGQLAAARGYYGRAIRVDPAFAPARQNLRRWFELDIFGATDLPLLLGDEQPRLWWLRRHSTGATKSDQPAATPTFAGAHHDN
jgi:hypothetical protein